MNSLTLELSNAAAERMPSRVIFRGAEPGDVTGLILLRGGSHGTPCTNCGVSHREKCRRAYVAPHVSACDPHAAPSADVAKHMAPPADTAKRATPSCAPTAGPVTAPTSATTIGDDGFRPVVRGKYGLKADGTPNHKGKNKADGGKANALGLLALKARQMQEARALADGSNQPGNSAQCSARDANTYAVLRELEDDADEADDADDAEGADDAVDADWRRTVSSAHSRRHRGTAH